MKQAFWVVKIGVLIVLAIVAFTFVTMWLWNWLIPDLFNGPVISFWQTLGLLTLSKILFSGFGKKGHNGGGHWKGYWKEKWHTMTPEEKERFKRKLKDKWCYPSGDTSTSEKDTSTV